MPEVVEKQGVQLESLTKLIAFDVQERKQEKQEKAKRQEQEEKEAVVRKTAEDEANKKQAEFELMVQRMMKLMEEKKLEMDKKMRHEPDAEEAKKTKSFVNANSVLFTKHTPWLLKSEGTAFFLHRLYLVH
jgi:hypothetical protein